MRKLLLPILLLFLIFPTSANAHGGPPFVAINGLTNLPNPVFSGSNLFWVTNELSAKNFAVGEVLNFTIDTNLAPLDQTQIAQTTFSWDMGDGNKVEGFNISYQYEKAGSYAVVLKVKTPDLTEETVLESVKVNILPDPNYQLPQAIVVADGKQITDPLQNPVLLANGSKLNLDGGQSKGNITAYRWDLADGSELRTDKKFDYAYDFSAPFNYAYFPILQVEDKNGLTSETIIQVTNKDALGETNAKSESSSTLLPIVFLVAGGLVGLGGLWLFLSGKKAKTKTPPN